MKKSIIIKNSHSDDMSCDIYYPNNLSHKLPLVIFLHGFKGFKDWGGFPYMLEKISENDAVMLCKDIVKKIEKDLTYPGQIKVTVIRETRVSDFAR